MAKGGRGGGEDIDETSAKDFLDSIGKIVYKKVHSEADGTAKNYIGDLKGNLASSTSTSLELVSTDDPCELQSEYDKLINGSGSGGGGDTDKRHPCKNLKGITNEERFSDTLGGQCTDSKIKGNKYIDRKDVGACAPYRRLHLCSHNLETIETTSTKTNKLLLEVCMAAKYEGASIVEKHPNRGSSEVCTALARSFADIGDIVRGRDLYLGNPQEKEKRKQLDKNLKEIFKNIKKENKSKLKSLKDEQIREYWWYANRATVWKAITCSEHLKNSAYFRQRACAGTFSTDDKCRCNGAKGAKGGDVNIVPTYFDYVPQFLRWFEEWAEDFCRLRKHKLEDAIKNCRDESKNLYCSGNGYNCKETIRGDEHFVEKDCHDCLVACSPFVKWLDNQKLEFLKQKEKYTKEIQKAKAEEETSSKGRKRRSTSAENHKGYHKEFYDILKTDAYKDGRMFFALLGKEGLCEKQPEVEGEKSFNFADEDTGTKFSRTQYCEPCPWCGLSNKEPPWKANHINSCGNKTEKKYHPEKKTDIPILTGDKTEGDMVRKYKTFCSTGHSQIKNWQCYYDKYKPSGQNNNCILGDWKNVKQNDKIMSYNKFFWEWVHDMLIDSIKWRDEHGKCINKDNGNKCKSGCNTKCKCFLKWVGQKENEWELILEHFKKQDDIDIRGPLGELSHDYVLEQVLKKDELLQIIQDAYGNADETEHIQKMLKEDAAEHGDSIVTGQNSIIVELLKHEKEDANKCLETHNDDKCNKAPPKPSTPAGGGPAGRADIGTDADTPRNGHTEEDDDEEEEEEEEEESSEASEETNGDTTEDTDAKVDPKDQVDGSATTTTDTSVDVCNIVDGILTGSGKLDAA
ncbi:hypothetical protein PFTANZ_03634, partial [Plasmodium falciparum Tanzania (2000708)]